MFVLLTYFGGWREYFVFLYCIIEFSGSSWYSFMMIEILSLIAQTISFFTSNIIDDVFHDNKLTLQYSFIYLIDLIHLNYYCMATN